MTDAPSRAAARALIRELVASGRTASPEDVARIRTLMATAPFDPSIVPVRTRYRGLSYGAIVLGRRALSLDFHMVKRTVVDEQWRMGITEGEYLDDLRAAIGSALARVGAYRRRGGIMAVAIVPTRAVVPAHRLGPSPLPSLLVVYAADRDIIVTGYQFSSSEEISIPEDARWLT